MGDQEIPVNTASPLLADNGSAISSEDADTYSLDDALKDYPILFGRTYHKYKEGSYMFPNDRQEFHRLNQQFWLTRIAQGRNLFFAPVIEPRKILDIGTGTGAWAIAVAEHMFPRAEITGTDLSPIQPCNVPKNVAWEVADCADVDWARPPASCDFIHCQNLFGSLQDYAQYLITARKYVVPGSGWIECCEQDPVPYTDDDSIPADWGLMKWTEKLLYAAELVGRPLRIAHKVKQWMIEAGFVDVHEIISKIPIGNWPLKKELRRLGRLFAALVSDSLAAASYKLFSEVLHESWEEIEIFLAAARTSLEDRKVHSYYRCYTVYGRRPSSDEEKKMGRMAPPPKPNAMIEEQEIE